MGLLSSLVWPWEESSLAWMVCCSLAWEQCSSLLQQEGENSLALELEESSLALEVPCRMS